MNTEFPPSQEPSPSFAPSKTFGRKAVKLSAGQKLVLEKFLPRYRIPFGSRVNDIDALFPPASPLHLEIGFGGGEYTACLAEACPDHRIIACELFQNGIARLLKEMNLRGIENIRIIHGDGVQVVEQMFSAGTFDFIHINHPDPWSKKKHHKRRLVQPRTVELFARSLKAGGEIWLSTDVEDYAQWMRECLDGCSLLEAMPARGRFTSHREDNPDEAALCTRYEEKGRAQGREPSYLRYRRR
ncbi:MAG: tRNA (guanosine(46)-N7)-methyltransferase TrmB [Nitrospirota bacterium]|nr:tRNA (guanosine(46)-N7)-methyltransferase TrmB [Nitrospirota bacterium]